MNTKNVPPMPFVAAIKKDPGPIPDLNPPRDQIAIDVPDKVILAGVLLLGFTALILGRIFHRPRVNPSLPPEHPASAARRLLGQIPPDESLAKAAADTALAMRGYLRSAFGLGDEALTTMELSARFEMHQLANPDLATEVYEFLRECDAAQFSTSSDALPSGLVGRGFELITELERRRLPPATMPPPLPAAT
jgi:hypothetical protein